MNVKRGMGFGIAAAVLAVAVLIGVLARKGAPEIQPSTSLVSETASAAGAKAAASEPTAAQVKRDTPRNFPAARTTRSRAVPAAPATSAKPEQMAAREKAVEAWEGFVDIVAERTDKPTAEQALQFKREFHKLDKEDQMDGIQTALNLLPDEQFPLLYPILFDKTEDPDVLDEIFSDGLNHEDDIKVPMMKEIYRDKEHPMYVEAARILDATGELDEMNERANGEKKDE